MKLSERLRHCMSKIVKPTAYQVYGELVTICNDLEALEDEVADMRADNDRLTRELADAEAHSCASAGLRCCCPCCDEKYKGKAAHCHDGKGCDRKLGEPMTQCWRHNLELRDKELAEANKRAEEAEGALEVYRERCENTPIPTTNTEDEGK